MQTSSHAFSPSRLFALIPCAGKGSRTGGSIPKQYQPLAGSAMLWHTLAAFSDCPQIARTLLVLAPDDAWFAPHQAPTWIDSQSLAVAKTGGSTRAESVRHGLVTLRDQYGAQAEDWVLVHDAARCLITPALIQTLIDACRDDRVGGLLALPLPDTLKAAAPVLPEAADSDGGSAPLQRVAATVPRGDKWLAQTPQMFRHGLLLQALESGLQHAPEGITDEASAVERMGLQPLLVPGQAQNIKVTYPEDFALAEAILAARARAVG